jgi:hypothetical protein
MADSTLNYFLASGTAAQRAAFTPTPPSPSNAPPNPGYSWYETDTDLLYAWDSVAAAWVQVGGGGGGGDVVGPASSTDEAIARFDGITGKLLQNSAVTIADTTGLMTGARFPNTGLKIRDTNASHDLSIVPGSDLTADRALTVVTGDADRQLTIGGTSAIDQDVRTTADPAFNTVKINDSDDSHKLTILQGSNQTADRNLTLETGDVNRTLELPRLEPIRITFDGGGSAIAADSKVYTRIPKGGTITKWTLLASSSGNIELDLWKDTYANYPPTGADSIVAAAPPALSAAIKNEDSTLTGWTTSIADGDTLVCNVDNGVTPTVTWAQLILEIALAK